MQRSFQALELAIGETVQIGSTLLTVIDIEDGEVSFRIESPGDDQPGPVDLEHLLLTV